MGKACRHAEHVALYKYLRNVQKRKQHVRARTPTIISQVLNGANDQRASSDVLVTGIAVQFRSQISACTADVSSSQNLNLRGWYSCIRTPDAIHKGYRRLKNLACHGFCVLSGGRNGRGAGSSGGNPRCLV